MCKITVWKKERKKKHLLDSYQLLDLVLQVLQLSVKYCTNPMFWGKKRRGRGGGSRGGGGEGVGEGVGKGGSDTTEKEPRLFFFSFQEQN